MAVLLLTPLLDTWQVSRVHYGLLNPKEMQEMSAAGGLPRSRRYLAVPFVGKDAPSHASEFAPEAHTVPDWPLAPLPSPL